MKWSATLLSIFCVAMIFESPLYAQDIKDKLVDIYFSSVAFPEDFDASIELLEASGNNDIQSCLFYVHDYYFQRGRAAKENCEAAHAGDPQREWQCLKSDPNASMWVWANGVILVLQGQRNSWLNTFSGGHTYQGKALAEQISPGSWVQMVRMGMPMIRQMISCP